MSQKLNEYIKSGWAKARTTSESGTLNLDLPFPFVPPAMPGNGIHRTLYYWDTYFTNIGLILDGYAEWARENVDNLLYALDVFGCVPNYTRTDGAQYCSQPPLLALMVRDVYEQTKDSVWLARAVQGLEKEYVFWMTNRITSIGLNQYGYNACREDLLSYYEYVSTRIALPQDISDDEKVYIAKNFVAEGESGEDYTPRYQNHNALEYVQIDLNAHLYGVEDFLHQYFEGKDAEKASFYLARKQTRLNLIEKYCFNEKTGAYCDYNFVKDTKNDIVCAACFLPYFYGFARTDSNISYIYQTLKCKGGIVSCQDTGSREYQWGYPNIWASHQCFAYIALTRNGKSAEAEELRQNYVQLLSSVYEQTGALWERYDENGAAADLEYPTQQMLGWTAGIYRYFVEQGKNS